MKKTNTQPPSSFTSWRNVTMDQTTRTQWINILLRFPAPLATPPPPKPHIHAHYAGLEKEGSEVALCQAYSCQETRNTLVSSGILITQQKHTHTHTFTHRASWERWQACRGHSKLAHPPVIPTERYKRKEEKRGSGGGQAVAFLSMPPHPLISLSKHIPCCPSPPLPILPVPSLTTSQHTAPVVHCSILFVHSYSHPSTCCSGLWAKHGQL